MPNIPQSKPGEPASNQVNQQSVFNSLRTDTFRWFQLLTYYMSLLVKIPLSVLPAIYDIKGIKTKINWTLYVWLFCQTCSHVQICQKPNITALSYLFLMAAETLAILMELQYPLLQPRNHHQSKGLEQRVKQYPVKMCQNNFGCQVTSSSSFSSEQHCHNIHIALSGTPTPCSQGKWEKNPSVWAAPNETNQ